MDRVLLRKTVSWVVAVPVFLVAFVLARIGLNMLVLYGWVTSSSIINLAFLIEVGVGIVVACLAVMPIWPKPTPSQVPGSKEN